MDDPLTMQSSDMSASEEIMFQTEMVTGGTYDIKIRVKSSFMKVYIDDCLKAQREVHVTEVVDQMIFAAGRMSSDAATKSSGEQYWLNGELSNIKYFAIGESCSVGHDTGVFDISDNGSCSCPDGFSGVTCQDATTPAPECTV